MTQSSNSLCIDIGNTRIKVGVFRKNKLVKKAIWTDYSTSQLKEITEKWHIDKIALSTVKGVKKTVADYLAKNFFYIELGSKTPLPIKNRYRTPDTLGKDRLAAIMGAYAFFPKQNCLVIDAGTCITYDIITAEEEYLGGNITPGIFLRLRAMHEFTAKLPLVERGNIRNHIGNTTESALQTGAQWATLVEMQGIIDAYEDKFGLINVILTGGDADYFAKKLKTKIFVNHNLVLSGLNKILVHNVQ